MTLRTSHCASALRGSTLVQPKSVGFARMDSVLSRDAVGRAEAVFFGFEVLEVLP